MILTDRRWQRIQKRRPFNVDVTVTDMGLTARCRCGRRMDMPPWKAFTVTLAVLRAFYSQHSGTDWRCAGRRPARIPPGHSEAHLA